MRTIFCWIKSLFLWLLVSENRAMGLSKVQMLTVALSEISKVTKTNKDDIAIKRIQDFIAPALDNLPDRTKKEAIKAVNEKKNTFNIKYDEKSGVSAGIGISF